MNDRLEKPVFRTKNILTARIQPGVCAWESRLGLLSRVLISEVGYDSYLLADHSCDIGNPCRFAAKGMTSLPV